MRLGKTVPIFARVIVPSSRAQEIVLAASVPFSLGEKNAAPSMLFIEGHHVHFLSEITLAYRLVQCFGIGAQKSQEDIDRRRI